MARSRGFGVGWERGLLQGEVGRGGQDGGVADGQPAGQTAKRLEGRCAPPQEEAGVAHPQAIGPRAGPGTSRSCCRMCPPPPRLLHCSCSVNSPHFDYGAIKLPSTDVFLGAQPKS